MARPCAIAATAIAPAASLAFAQDKPSDLRLGAGDSIKVQVYQSPDLTLEARVSESGVINYPPAVRLQDISAPTAARLRASSSCASRR